MALPYYPIFDPEWRDRYIYGVDHEHKSDPEIVDSFISSLNIRRTRTQVVISVARKVYTTLKKYW